ncbi:MAG: HypC/HybG/HupF family hydrogenase formation chaperone [Gammaproteobacteria bacterium]|nr:HypC/HybG/HupF family hydrogenase formation chaperone [Gammaproteobacteria bacterium]
MCLALPAKIISMDETSDTAMVALGEVNVEVSLALVEDVQIDDFVLVHVGYALNKISQEEADETLRLFAEAGLTGEADS